MPDPNLPQQAAEAAPMFPAWMISGSAITSMIVSLLALFQTRNKNADQEIIRRHEQLMKMVELEILKARGTIADEMKAILREYVRTDVINERLNGIEERMDQVKELLHQLIDRGGLPFPARGELIQSPRERNERTEWPEKHEGGGRRGKGAGAD